MDETMSAFLTPGLQALCVGAALVFLIVSLYGLFVAGSRRGHLMAAAVLIALVLMASLSADIFVTPRYNLAKSGRFFCEDARPYLADAKQVYLLFFYFLGFY